MTRQHNRSSKRDPANQGPYLITAITKGGSYVLRDMEGQQLARNYTRSELIPISDRPIFQEASLEVERILGHRLNKAREYEYHVRWADEDEKDSWEPFSNFDSTDVIQKYWQEHNKAQKETKEARQKRTTQQKRPYKLRSRRG
ncbi:hypothetical protein DL89DRAFT_221426 [Linderina pennispora]|uniref:Chromo domain-containing protein n=1 Tax=Linderina pennispora TaxID=61395 RepID=A0A1Y1WGY1_9FUNG|nr:uncharacterized protein DL89DRAFT_221426 [Linderina pennispora]ORX72384.1 hypothetical protein DL89DRAFT_221426 [Linderina pennispora]